MSVHQLARVQRAKLLKLEPGNGVIGSFPGAGWDDVFNQGGQRLYTRTGSRTSLSTRWR